MRVAFLGITVGIEPRGGEAYIHNLANHLVDRGHDVHVLQGGPARDGARYRARRIAVPYRLGRAAVAPLSLSFSSLRERVARQGNRLLHHAFAAAASVELARLRPDIVVPLVMRPELAPARMLRRTIKCSLVSVGHGDALNDAEAVAGVDAFVATSPRQAEWARYFGAAEVELIPVGVDLQRFHPGVTPAAVALPGPIILQVGSLLPVKRPLLSVEAVARLGRGSLLVLGDGPLARELDDTAARRLGARYLRLPRVSYGELAGYYRAAGALVFPSDIGETAGLVLLEALACGTPVAASDDETRRWLLGGAAQLADPRDADGFAAAIEAALSDGNGAARRAHAERFGWATVAARHEALYQRLRSSISRA